MSKSSSDQPENPGRRLLLGGVSYSIYRQFVEDASITGRKFRFGFEYKF